MLSTSMQSLKDRLVRRGPDSKLVQTALRIHCHRHGYQIEFPNDTIRLAKSGRVLVLNKAQYIQVPVMLEMFDMFFETMVSKSVDDVTLLDFSRPALHKYKRDGREFYFPSVVEDDVLDAYTHAYTPQPGDVVWDVGAHAGASAYYLSQMVGPKGKVYAFEPDVNNYQYLIKNIELHDLQNVFPSRKALSGTTGTAQFCMDGTLYAGITDYLVYSEQEKYVTVETITFADACEELGSVPTYVKMDIEGAEVATVEGSLEFLKAHPVHFAIESYHRYDGEFTFRRLERIFPKIGYKVWSSDKFGQMFTWATPPER